MTPAPRLLSSPRLNWLAPPPIASALPAVEDAIDGPGIRQPSTATASLIGAAVISRALSADEARSVMAGNLSMTTVVSRLGQWMNGVIHHLCPQVPKKEYPRLSLAITEDNNPELLLESCSPVAYAIPANTLDPILSSALWDSYDGLHGLGYGALALHCRDYCWWEDTLIQEITELDQQGLLDKPKEAFAAAKDMHMEISMDDSYDSFAELLTQYSGWSERTLPAWRSHPERRTPDQLIAEVATWRTEQPDIYRSPWAKIVRGIAQDRRIAARASRLPEGHALEDRGGMPIELSAPILFGEAWENDTLQAWHEGLMNGGEALIASWSFPGVAPYATRNTLYFIARAAGWLLQSVYIEE